VLAERPRIALTIVRLFLGMRQQRVLASFPPYTNAITLGLTSLLGTVCCLAGFAFGCGLAEQDALNGWRHVATGFFPVDALDGSFSAGRLSVVHEAPPRKIIRPRSQTHET